MMYFMGIDPGLTGAAVVLKREGGGELMMCRFWQQPVTTFTEGKGKKATTKNLIDLPMFRNRLIALLGEDAILPSNVITVIEKPMPAIGSKEGGSFRGSLGTSSLFRSFGQIEGVLAGLQFTYTAVSPQTWKANILKGTAKDKAAAYNLAYAFPTMASILDNVVPTCKRTKSDCQGGVADAFCIALHAASLFKY